MINILKLEMKIVNPKIDTLFCQAINKLANVLIILNKLDEKDVSVLVYLTIDHYNTSVLKPTSMTSQIYF